MQILYEDNHIISVNKPNGILVQGDKTGDKTLIEEVKFYLKKKFNKKGNVFLGLTHRLDRPVSGAILFAKSSKALTRFNKMFQLKEKSILKTYWAIVKNCPPKENDTIKHYLRKDRVKNKSYAYDNFKKGRKLSSLTYKLIGRSNKYFFLEIILHTGRHHQIRCQLSKIGCPIKGDLKYGYTRSNPDKGISLHAREISFIHPVNRKSIQIVAPCFKDILWDMFTSIKN